MEGVNRYDNQGVEYAWVVDYFSKKDEFWGSTHGLGPNKIKHLIAFLSDCGVLQEKTHALTPFGTKIDSIGIETSAAWGVLLCNLVYTPEFKWWIMYT